MSDPNDYAAKLAALEAAKAQVESLVAGLSDCPEKKIRQGNWRNTAITNIPEGTSFPSGSYPPPGSPSINGLQWAPARDVGKALNAYHKSLKEARHAYHALRAAGQNVNPPEP